MKKLIAKINTSHEFLEDAQMNFENLQLITQKQLLKKHKIDLEHTLKNLENNLTSDENRKFYNHYKNE